MRLLWHATEIGALHKLFTLDEEAVKCAPPPLPSPESEKLLAGHPEEGTNEPLREFPIYELAGLPALQLGEPGQVRKEAATAKYCKCRG